jgi:hypothetical protein
MVCMRYPAHNRLDVNVPWLKQQLPAQEREQLGKNSQVHGRPCEWRYPQRGKKSDRHHTLAFPSQQLRPDHRLTMVSEDAAQLVLNQ